MSGRRDVRNEVRDGPQNACCTYASSNNTDFDAKLSMLHIIAYSSALQRLINSGMHQMEITNVQNEQRKIEDIKPSVPPLYIGNVVWTFLSFAAIDRFSARVERLFPLSSAQ